MVVKCAHCFELMRVDDSRVPEGKPVKVRCPHCQGIGIVELAVREAYSTAPVTEPVIAVPRAPQAPAERVPQAESRQELFDPLDEIQFPADRGFPERPPEPSRKWLRMAIWTAISVAVVGFFALLVNIVLPGPRPSTQYRPDQLQQQNVPQPDDLLGDGSGPNKPVPKQKFGTTN